MVIFAPYRICPLGAHIDHQLGIILGTTLKDTGIYLTFKKNIYESVRLHGVNYKQFVEFPLGDILPEKDGYWPDYAKGAVYALKSTKYLRQGIDGAISANFPGGGLSSSAAVSVAYLLALESVNNLEVSARENIKLVQKIENEYIGLNNGILDQSVILLSKDIPNSMVCLDCKTMEHRIICPPQPAPAPPGREENNHLRLHQSSGGQATPSPLLSPEGRGIKGEGGDFEVAVVYSGIEKQITNTDYNKRVSECQEAARLLTEMGSGHFSSPPHPNLLPQGEKGKECGRRVMLRDVPLEVYEGHGKKLPSNLRKRAKHFFSEMARVKKGAVLWEKGDMEGFGKLVAESGKSSIENYECGSPALVRIYELLNSIDGVYGARFSGAGFRGSCIGIIKPSENIRERIKDSLEKHYAKEFPEYAKKYKVLFCKTGGSAKVL